MISHTPCSLEIVTIDTSRFVFTINSSKLNLRAKVFVFREKIVQRSQETVPIHLQMLVLVAVIIESKGVN